MKKCLVLGAGGFMGKSLCKELINDYEIVLFDRKIPKELTSLNGYVKYVEGDFTKMEDFSPLLKGVDKVIHLISTTIPQEETTNIDMEISQNIIPTVQLLECMVKTGVPEIIFSSSGGTIYGEANGELNKVGDELHPICGYGVQKKTIEAYLEFYGLRYGINYKIMRISNPYGVGQDPKKPQGVIPIFVYRLLHDMPITIYGDGCSKRDYIYMSDLIEAFKQTLAYNGDIHIFNIGSGSAHTLNEVIDLIEYKSGKKFCEISYMEKRNCDILKNQLEVDTTWKELHWRAKIGLEQGIENVIKYYAG